MLEDQQRVRGGNILEGDFWKAWRVKLQGSHAPAMLLVFMLVGPFLLLATESSGGDRFKVCWRDILGLSYLGTISAVYMLSAGQYFSVFPSVAMSVVVGFVASLLLILFDGRFSWILIAAQIFSLVPVVVLAAIW